MAASFQKPQVFSEFDRHLKKKVLNRNSDHLLKARIQLYIDSKNFMQKYLSVVEFYSFKLTYKSS